MTSTESGMKQVIVPKDFFQVVFGNQVPPRESKPGKNIVALAVRPVVQSIYELTAVTLVGSEVVNVCGDEEIIAESELENVMLYLAEEE